MKKILLIVLIILIFTSTIITTGQMIKKITDSTDDFNYIIITNNYLENSLKELTEYRELQGFKVKIVTGMRNPEEIRDFLKSKYQDWNIEYVLIIGSSKTVPMKYIWANIENNKFKIFERFIGLPTDHYYAELTHNWDLDGDGYYSEFDEDIKNNTDLLPEIAVGRIPFDSPKKVKDFCKKIISYEKDNGNWKKNALFLANIQEYKDQFIDNAFFAEKLQHEMFIANGFNCTKLYEAEGLKPTNYSYNLPLNHLNVIKTWRRGFGFVSIMGRGSSKSAMRNIWTEDDGNGIADENDTFKIGGEYIIHSFDKFLLPSNKPSVVYSFTCFTAQNKKFSLCSSLLDSVAVVFIGPVSGNKAGWQMKYNFTDYFTNTNMRIGDAFFKAKTDYINSDGGIDNIYTPVYVSNISIRWNVLNTGFYGDPATLRFVPPIL